MTKEFKETIFYSLIYIVLYLIVAVTLRLIFSELKTMMIVPIAVTIAYLLSPRFKSIDTQSGKKYQIKSRFMKKTFVI